MPTSSEWPATCRDPGLPEENFGASQCRPEANLLTMELDESDPGGPDLGEVSPGEELLRIYLDSRELPYEYEAVVGGRNPDFLVSLPAGRVALEVHEPKLKLPVGRVGQFSSPQAVRRGLQGRKYKQAKATHLEGLPYVLVIASTRSDIGYEPLMVASAMFGDLQHTMRLDLATGSAEDLGPSFGGGGRLQSQRNRAISAVALVQVFNPTYVSAVQEPWRRERDSWPVTTSDEVIAASIRVQQLVEDAARRGDLMPDARAIRLVVLHNPHAHIPLLVEAFGGPHDVQWGLILIDDAANYGEYLSGVRAREVPD